jgi:hypothetical protein
MRATRVNNSILVPRGDQPLVSVGTDATKLTAALRQAGIFLEGDLVVPSA